MLKADRDSIEVNLVNLVRVTDYSRLLARCLERRILFDVMRDKIESAHDTEAKRHRALFRQLMKRGPDAFAALLQICERDFPEAVRILRNERSINPVRVRPIQRSVTMPGTIAEALRQRPGCTADNTLVEFTAQLPPPTAFERVQPATTFHCNQPNEIACYPMRSRNRGVAFLVNIINFHNRPHEPRLGADKDKVNLVQLFRQMGFTVMYYENRTAVELRALLNELRNSRWLRNTDCFVMALMTHGTMINDVAKVEFYDNSFLNLSEVVDYFSNSKSEALLHKPKVFVFPFCRGSEKEKPLDLQRLSTAGSRGSGGGHSQSDAAAINRATESGGGSSPPDIEPAANGGGADVGDAAPLPAIAAAAVAESSLSASSSSSSIGGSKRISAISDIKICYATGPGFEAMREERTGSWYIESMCGIWAKYAHNKSLDDLLKMVGEYQSNKESELGNIQTAHSEDRGFFKKLFFNPGYYGEVAVPVEESQVSGRGEEEATEAAATQTTNSWITTTV